MNSGKMTYGRPVAARKKRIKDYLRIAMFATAAVITTTFQWGCVREDYNGSPGTAVGDDVEVMIMMNVPSVASSTRAMTKKQENSIDYLNVLVFLDPRDGSDETYLYTTYATQYVASDDGSTSTVKVGFRKNVSGEYHRFVFIANMKDSIAELQGSWDETMTKADVLETLTFDAYPATAATEPERVWDTATPRYLPMWGETTDSYVVTSSLMGSTLGTIKMLRSVATVDIVLNPDVDGTPLGFSGEFELHDIKVYNVPQKGYAAPDPDNLTAMLAEKPTYSTTFTRNAATTVAYETDQTADEHLYGISRLVYIPEAPNTDGAGTNIDDLEQTCLVISGYYDGSPDLSWYRLDFIDKLSATENVRYDILRNHRYTFYITAVEGPGYPDEPTAFKSAPLNLDSEVLVWDEEDMPDIVFDGNYAFRVNPPDSVVMYMEGEKKYITVKTDHPDGWDIDAATIPDFISNHWIETGNERDTLYFEATPITNALELGKEGYITFLSGKLRKKVKVVQLNEAELTLEIDPQMLFFQKSAGTAKSVTVTAYPADIPIMFGIVDGGGIDWSQQGSVYPTNAQGLQGSGVYEFKPPKNLTNNDRSSSITVSVTKGGKIVTKIINIFQWATDLMFRVIHPYPPENGQLYPAVGGTFDLTVESQTKWWVSGVTDLLSMIAGGIDQTERPEGQSTYTISLNGNDTWGPRTVNYHTLSDNIDFPREDIVVTQDYVRPHISVNTQQANPKVLDFWATDYADEYWYTLKVTSNAAFLFSVQPGYESVYTHVYPNPSGNSNNPLVSSIYDVKIKPTKYYGVAGTPAAGTIYTTKATFTTGDHHPATEVASEEITIERRVPAFFTNPLIYGVTLRENGYLGIPRTGQQITLYGDTNAAWFAYSWYDDKVQQYGHWTIPPQQFQQSGVYLDLPSNETWADRWITITQKYGFDEQAMVNVGGEHIIVQPGYYFKNIFIQEINNAGVGGYYTVRANGDFPDMQVRMSADGIGWDNSFGILGEAVNGHGVAWQVRMPDNESWYNRLFNIDYKHPGDNKWHVLYDEHGTNAVWTQLAAYSLAYSYSDVQPTVSNVGEIRNFFFAGNVGSSTFQVRVRDGNGTILSTNEASSNLQQQLWIPANTGGNSQARNLTFQYHHPTNGWTDIPNLSTNQPIGPYETEKYYVSRETISTTVAGANQACKDAFGQEWFHTIPTTVGPMLYDYGTVHVVYPVYQSSLKKYIGYNYWWKAKNAPHTDYSGNGDNTDTPKSGVRCYRNKY